MPIIAFKYSNLLQIKRQHCYWHRIRNEWYFASKKAGTRVTCRSLNASLEIWKISCQPACQQLGSQSSHVAEARAARLNYRRVANLRLNAYFRTPPTAGRKEAHGQPFSGRLSWVLWKNTFRLEVRLSAN